LLNSTFELQYMFINVIININTNFNEKTACCSSQVAVEHVGHFLEGQSNWWRVFELILDNKVNSDRRLHWLAQWACATNGSPAHSATCIHFACWEFQWRKISPRWLRTHWFSTVYRQSKGSPSHLGGSTDGRSSQTWMPSDLDAARIKVKAIFYVWDTHGIWHPIAVRRSSINSYAWPLTS